MRDGVAVLAHEDCDALEPAHLEVASRIEQALETAGCPGVPIAVTPAWEIETWWMVFPEAVGAVVTGWREPSDWVGRDVGRVAHAKEALTNAVRPRSGGRAKPPRDYRESDSITIAQNIVSQGSLASFSRGARTIRTPTGKVRRTQCNSFERFRENVLKLPRR